MKLEFLKKIAEYCPDTGVVKWKDRGPELFPKAGDWAQHVSSRWQKFRAGNVVGTKTQYGYLTTYIDKKTYFVHRLAWALHYGEWPKGQIDHINGVKDDNRIENLRDVCSSVNAKNKRKSRRNSSGFIGVDYVKKSKRWRARISTGGRRIEIGQYKTPEEAAKAYEAVKQSFGFHPNHGKSIDNQNPIKSGEKT